MSKGNERIVVATINNNCNSVKAAEKLASEIESKLGVEVVSEKSETAKPEFKVEAIKPAQVIVPELTLEQRIARVEDLSVLIERFRILSESKRKLQQFVLGSEGMGSNICLTDSRGQEFKTTNSQAIEACISAMEQTITARITEVEAKIKF